MSEKVFKKALITGATGFVGQALIARMAREDLACREVRRSTKNLSHMENGLTSASHFFVTGIDGTTSWEGAFDGVDVVIHLAALAHQRKVLSWDDYRRCNVEGTLHLAREAERAGVSRFVHVSSIKANDEENPRDGRGRIVPFSESLSAAPQDPYGRSKWEAEMQLQKRQETAKMGIAIIRPPLVYGPRVKANFLALLKLVRRGVPLPLGGVSNQRSLIYVENLVSAILLCAQHPLATGQTFIVADGEPVSTSSLVKMMASSMGKTPRLLNIPENVLSHLARITGQSARWCKLAGSLVVDDRKIRETLEWQPPYSTAAGVAKTCEWFLKSRDS